MSELVTEHAATIIANREETRLLAYSLIDKLFNYNTLLRTVPRSYFDKEAIYCFSPIKFDYYHPWGVVEPYKNLWASEVEKEPNSWTVYEFYPFLNQVGFNLSHRIKRPVKLFSTVLWHREISKNAVTKSELIQLIDQQELWSLFVKSNEGLDKQVCSILSEVIADQNYCKQVSCNTTEASSLKSQLDSVLVQGN